jgi:hypothetical protein
MQHTVTTHATDPLTITMSAHRHPKFVPGWITTNTIVMPRCGGAAQTLSAGVVTADETAQLGKLFTATADRLAHLVNHLARLERDADSGAVSADLVSRRLRRILAAIESLS